MSNININIDIKILTGDNFLRIVSNKR